jgi:adenylylsulfate kinase-like enzyme
MIARALSATEEAAGEMAAVSAAATRQTDRVSQEEREARAGHRAVTVWLDAPPELAYAVERQLFDIGCQAAVVGTEIAGGRLAEIARALNSAGAIAVCIVPGSGGREQARGIIGPERFVFVEASRLPSENLAAAAEVCQLLRAAGYLGTAPAS